MELRLVRWAVQHLSFLVLTYGGRFGLNLGSALPCFSCPYISGCSGYCYLMGLQGFIGFGMTVAAIGGTQMWTALAWLGLFIVLVALLGKTWCGWICPFGLVQDWLTKLRVKLGIRERQLSPKVKKVLAPVKYVFLFYLVAIPPLITMGLLHDDFHLPFCSICPAKSLMPLFALDTKYLVLNLSNEVTLIFSALLLIITGLMLVGMFLKERFFCIFCPLLALIHLLKPVTALRLVKNPTACIGCGNCRRACPMDIEKVYRERKSSDVQTAECLNCASCGEACSSNAAISLKFGKFNLFSSSKAYAAKFGNK